jgi:hypothetical protein
MSKASSSSLLLRFVQGEKKNSTLHRPYIIVMSNDEKAHRLSVNSYRLLLGLTLRCPFGCCPSHIKVIILGSGLPPPH